MIARGPLAETGDEVVIHGRSTSIRDPAVQRSPFSENTPNSALSTARSRSASAKTTHGDFPPSSIDSPFSYWPPTA